MHRGILIHSADLPQLFLCPHFSTSDETNQISCEIYGRYWYDFGRYGRWDHYNVCLVLVAFVALLKFHVFFDL